MRPRLLTAVAVLLLTALSAAPASAAGLSHGDRAALQHYAADTWHSFDLLVDAHTGLPDDNVTADGTRSGYTSPTNIGAYLWSTLGAREIGLIGRREATARTARTLATLAHMQRGPSGQFFNWYDPATGARLSTGQRALHGRARAHSQVHAPVAVEADDEVPAEQRQLRLGVASASLPHHLRAP